MTPAKTAPTPNTLHCGDNVTIMSQWPDECIPLTVTSPPYDLVEWRDGELVTDSSQGMRDYEGYQWDFAAVAEQLYRITQPGGVVVWVVADKVIDGSESGSSFVQALYFKRLGFRLHDTMIYATKKPPLSHNRYEQEHEYMFVFSKKKPKTTNLIRERSVYAAIDKRRSGKYTHNNGYQGERKAIRNGINRRPPKPTKIKGNIWWFATGGGHDTDKIKGKHAATFPDALARDHILSWSNPGDTVLDPFLGSGTTAKMALAYGRQYIGIDVSQKYLDIAQQRIDLAERQPALIPQAKIEQATMNI